MIVAELVNLMRQQQETYHCCGRLSQRCLIFCLTHDLLLSQRQSLSSAQDPNAVKLGDPIGLEIVA